MEIFKAPVTDIKWFTTAFGMVKPVAVLNKTYRKHNYEFDSVALDDAFSIEDHGISSGSVLRLKAHPNAKIKVKGSDNKKAVKGVVLYPGKCPMCKTQLVKYKERDLYCPNDFCEAKSRTPVLKFVTTAIPEMELIHIYEWLNAFPIDNFKSSASIMNLFELFYFIEENRPYDTGIREKRYMEFHAQADVDLKELIESLEAKEDKDEAVKRHAQFQKTIINAIQIEAALINKLKQGYSLEEFWENISLKDLTQDDKASLSQMNPDRLLEKDGAGMVDALEAKEIELSEEGKHTIVFNYKLIFKTFQYLSKLKRQLS